jgi:hypothetical protein
VYMAKLAEQAERYDEVVTAPSPHTRMKSSRAAAWGYLCCGCRVKSRNRTVATGTRAPLVYPGAAHLAGDARMRILSGISGMPCESRGGGGASMEFFKFVSATTVPFEMLAAVGIFTHLAGWMCRRCGKLDGVLGQLEGERAVEVRAGETRGWRPGPGGTNLGHGSLAQLDGRRSLQPVFASHATGIRGCTSSPSVVLCGHIWLCAVVVCLWSCTCCSLDVAGVESGRRDVGDPPFCSPPSPPSSLTDG